MSNGPNHRRGHGRIQDNGPIWEGGPPSSGCNSTHVARSRRKWQNRRRRRDRRKASELAREFKDTPNEADQALFEEFRGRFL